MKTNEKTSWNFQNFKFNRTWTESIEGFFPQYLENCETQNKLNESKKLKQQIDKNDLMYQKNKYVYKLTNFQTIRSFVIEFLPESKIDQEKKKEMLVKM